MTTPKLSLPHINRKFVYIGGASLIVLVLFSFAVVQQVKNDRIETARRAETAQKQEQTTLELKAKLAASEKATATAKTDQEAVCSWVRSVVPKYKIAVPPLCIKS